MSLNKSTTRRLSLLTGSSLVAAGLSAFVCAGAALAPTAAVAQAVCAPVPTAGAGTNSVSYGDAAYNSGITCTANGDLTFEVTADGVDIGGSGIQLIAGANDITFSAHPTIGGVATPREVEGRGVVGAVIDIATTSGNIDILAEEVDADAASASGTTHAIRARSSGGDIDIETTGSVALTASSAPATAISIEAVSTGGGDVSIITSGTVNGRLRAILASSTGAGATSLVLNGSASGGGVEVSSGTGGFDVQINDGSTASLQTSGPVGGEIRLGADGTLGPLMTVAAAGSETVVHVGGLFRAASGSLDATDFAHVASGSGQVTVNIDGDGRIRGHVDYSALSGGATLNVNNRLIVSSGTGGWQIPDGVSTFGSGDDTLNVASTGLIRTDAGDVTLDFGSGDDVFSNAGMIVVADSATTSPASLTIENLGPEGIRNSGLIALGAGLGSGLATSNVVDMYDIPPDLFIHHTFVLRNSRFVGEEGSRIYLTAMLGATTQDGCAVQSAADCVDFQGTTTEGRTLIRVGDASPSFDGYRNDGIVLIDVSGGSSSADHFELDPGSLGYAVDSTLGPVIRKGLIAYDLVYNEDAQKHLLVGVLGSEGYQFQILPSLALNAWRTTTGTWFDRQADLRDTLGGPGVSKGMWIKGAADFTSRDIATSFDLAGASFAFDQGHTQKTGTIIVGADLITADSASRGYVFGAMLGFMNSITEFDESLTRMEFTGPTGGLYASYVAGGLFLDGVVNASLLNMNQDAPGLDLGEGVRLKQDITMVGGQVEGGWRTRLGGGVFVEPLATVSYVRTQFEDIETAGSTVDFAEEAASFRGALGLRAGLDAVYGAARVSYTVTGRAWNEFEGENPLVLELPGESMPMMDDLSGMFGEVGAGVSLSDETGLVSGFLNGAYRFQEDYRSAGFSAGLRLRW